VSRLQELLSMIRGYYEEFVDALREYECGEERVYAVERLAQLIAQCILDFAAVLASRGVKPGSYRELARWLARRAGLGSDLAEFLGGLVGFCNILVHMYAEINRELEMEAFKEIAEKMPRVVARLAKLARDDPCIGEVKQRIRRAAERLGLRLVLLFGSLARSGCGRDVDLAVRLGRRPRSMLEVGRLQAVLEDELGVSVDLVVLDLGVSPALAKTLVDEAVLVYGDPGEAEEELLRLYKLYLDHVEASKARVTAAGPQRQ